VSVPSLIFWGAVTVSWRTVVDPVPGMIV
jgi:hypothetical protein